MRTLDSFRLKPAADCSRPMVSPESTRFRIASTLPPSAMGMPMRMKRENILLSGSGTSGVSRTPSV